MQTDHINSVPIAKSEFMRCIRLDSSRGYLTSNFGRIHSIHFDKSSRTWTRQESPISGRQVSPSLVFSIALINLHRRWKQKEIKKKQKRKKKIKTVDTAGVRWLN